MGSNKVAILTVAAAMTVAVLGSSATVQAGSTTYPVEIAANGGVGGCQSSTGSMSNVTRNESASPVTIQCPTPNGFAWGRNLDTPDEVVDAALVDDGSDIVAGFKQTGANNSKGRKLGLMMRIADMRPNKTELLFEGDAAAAEDFTSSYDLLPNGKTSKRANLKLRLPKGADIQSGIARCKTANESAGITWAADQVSAKGNAFRKWTPQVLIDCSGIGTNNAQTFNSASASMTPDAVSPKLMSAIATCSDGKQAVAGGYDISGSTTSQWPNIVMNGPDSVSGGIANAWRVTVAVPSQNSSSAKANLKVWVTCKG